MQIPDKLLRQRRITVLLALRGRVENPTGALMLWIVAHVFSPYSAARFARCCSIVKGVHTPVNSPYFRTRAPLIDSAQRRMETNSIITGVPIVRLKHFRYRASYEIEGVFEYGPFFSS